MRFNQNGLVTFMLIGCLTVGLSSAAWQVEIVDSNGDVGRSSCIALGSDGYPHISYYKNDTKDLKYAKKSGTGWEPETIDTSGDVGLLSSMCLRAGLYPYITYVNADTNDLKLAYYESNAWHIEVLQTDYDAAIGAVLTLNPQGYPYISYTSSDANSFLRVRYNSASGWVERDITYNVEDHDCVIDLSSYLQLAYTVHPTGESTWIRWAGMYGPTVNYETVLESAHFLLDVEFYWNPDDYESHLIYGDSTAPSLEYARKENSVWDFETIDNVYPAPNPCLAVDSTRYPHVLYGDATEGILKYAWKDVAGWHLENVPIAGATGIYNSLVLDSQDMAHISTYDSSNKDLIYAQRSLTEPTPTPPPNPTPTPTANCTTLGVHLYMPSNSFSPGDPCGCDLYLCNPDGVTYAGTPVFVILDILGNYYFAPDFSNFNHYTQDVFPGMTKLVVLPIFNWPTGAGTFAGAIWYAAMTDAGISMLFGEMDMFEFGWME